MGIKKLEKLVMNGIGIMQGRLLPKYKERYQAHPVGYWDEEFSIAAIGKCRRM